MLNALFRVLGSRHTGTGTVHIRSVYERKVYRAAARKTYQSSGWDVSEDGYEPPRAYDVSRMYMSIEKLLEYHLKNWQLSVLATAIF